MPSEVVTFFEAISSMRLEQSVEERAFRPAWQPAKTASALVAPPCSIYETSCSICGDRTLAALWLHSQRKPRRPSVQNQRSCKNHDSLIHPLIADENEINIS